MNLLDFYIPEWFFVALSLIILVLVMKKVLWSRVNAVLDERRQKIEDALEEAKSIAAERTEMDARRTDLETELDRLTAHQMKGARVRAGKEYDKIIADAEEKAKGILTSARTQGERERERLLREAQSEMVSAALMAAGSLLEERMDNDANERFVESVLFRKGTHS